MNFQDVKIAYLKTLTIETETEALKAVEQNGYALQYVKDRKKC